MELPVENTGCNKNNLNGQSNQAVKLIIANKIDAF
jgi:hypothetical protein